MIITPQTKSIFLAGPIPRVTVDFQETWQHAAALISRLDENVVVYCPMPFSLDGYESQIEWEEDHLEEASVILFWVPRHIAASVPEVDMSAFTTNVEFGDYYLIALYSKYRIFGASFGKPRTILPDLQTDPRTN